MSELELIHHFRRPGRESGKAKRTRTAEIVERLGREYPDSRCSLVHDDPLQLLVATVLSAQCTDALVNQVTPDLFAKYHEAGDYATASQEEMEEDLGRVNYYRSKAKSLRGIGEALLERHGGEVPNDPAALVELPGVGRKTANVVLGVGFGIAEGVVVDTHVKRITHRLGLTRESDPKKVEKDLLPLVPEEERVVFTHRMIDHGRAVCVARRPRCERCVLADICPTGVKRLAA